MDLNKVSSYGLIRLLGSKGEDLDKRVDEHILSRCNEYRDIGLDTYWVSLDKIKYLPKTQQRINDLVIGHYKERGDYFSYGGYAKWFTDDTKTFFLKEWIKSEYNKADQWMMKDLDFCPNDMKLNVLAKLIEVYNGSRSKKNLGYIQEIYQRISDDNVAAACAIISSASSAVQPILLAREDIDDEYVISGLKALSKLSRQRKMDINIELKSLSRLGPKARLGVMKQLFGMHSQYYKFKKKQKENPNSYYWNNSWRERKIRRKSVVVDNLPFKNIPNRQDIEEFLFPCVMLYHEDVAAVLERFDELVIKEKKDGESVQK